MERIKKDHWLRKKFIAHRGFHNEIYPENSLGAFQYAIDNNFAIELDIHLLKDGNIIVFHDDNLYRMTGFNRDIKNTTWTEIKDLRLKNTEYCIPLFSNVLELVAGKVPLLIEFKTGSKNHALEEKAWEILKNYKHEYAIQSFDPFIVFWFRKNAPFVIRGILSGSFKNEKLPFYKKFILKKLLLRKKIRPDFINYEIDFLKSKIILKLSKKNIILGWTARNKKTFFDNYNLGYNCIFENFNPNNK
ncbi:glycerophosphodiester phosphodiesterase family protein [Mycoplasma elephantis]|uniref:glycerophosphodiester phosphodiesterase family protein n=1 Tax=Mycoplasma elephantis TaxID=114882 RepID=UPI0005630BA3|nr:glycerophosphodiester phosphodiesterase family protein [Mycoplasma elephantis]